MQAREHCRDLLSGTCKLRPKAGTVASRLKSNVPELCSANCFPQAIAGVYKTSIGSFGSNLVAAAMLCILKCRYLLGKLLSLLYARFDRFRWNVLSFWYIVWQDVLPVEEISSFVRLGTFSENILAVSFQRDIQKTPSGPFIFVIAGWREKFRH